MEGAIRTKNLESVTRIENLEGTIGTKNNTIGSRTEYVLSTKIRNSERTNKILDLAEIVKLLNIGQIPYPKYPIAVSFIV